MRELPRGTACPFCSAPLKRPEGGSAIEVLSRNDGRASPQVAGAPKPAAVPRAAARDRRGHAEEPPRHDGRRRGAPARAAVRGRPRAAGDRAVSARGARACARDLRVRARGGRAIGPARCSRRRGGRCRADDRGARACARAVGSTDRGTSGREGPVADAGPGAGPAATDARAGPENAAAAPEGAAAGGGDAAGDRHGFRTDAREAADSEVCRGERAGARVSRPGAGHRLDHDDRATPSRRFRSRCRWRPHRRRWRRSDRPGAASRCSASEWASRSSRSR